MTDADWVLAIDFGTSFTLAAAREHGRPAEVIEIDGERRMPSVVMVANDGSVIVGRAADESAAITPGRVLRAPKTRLGDPAPVVLGGRPFEISQLVAQILAKVFDNAQQYHGGPPQSTRLTFPASWSGQRRNQLLRAAEMAGLRAPVLIPEPVAAAIAYAEAVGVAPGRHVLIYDLGGGTFDCALLRATAGGFEVAGRPSGDRQLGGELFDELLANAIGAKLPPEEWEQLQVRDDALWLQAWAGLQREARRAKELLSLQPYVDVALAVPNGIRTTGVSRDELDRIVEPYLRDSVQIVRHVLADAGVPEDSVDAIYLVGGASRMPLVATLIAEEFAGIAVSTRNDPKAAVALGATHPGLSSAAEAMFPAPVWATDPNQAPPAARAIPPPPPARVPDTVRVASPPPPDGPPVPSRRSRRRRLAVGAEIIAVLGLGALGAVALLNDDSPAATPSTESSSPPASNVATGDSLGGPDPTHDVVFSSNRDGDFELFTMNSDGTGQWQRTANSVDDQFPAWSPDGSRIAWTQAGEIVSMDSADGSDIVRLTADIDDVSSKPAWSPDGSLILFVRLVGGHSEVWRMDATTGANKRPVVSFDMEDRDAYDPAVMSDGTVVYSSAASDSRVDLYLTDLDGTSRRPMATLNGDGVINETVDPANRSATISFSRLTLGGQYDVMQAGLDGDGLVNLTESVVGGQIAFDAQPSWSPDDTAMVLVTGLDGDWEIWRMNADGGEARPLTDNGAMDADPDWRPQSLN